MSSSRDFFVVVNVKPMDQDGKDLEWYALGMQCVIAEIDRDFSQLDMTH